MWILDGCEPDEIIHRVIANGEWRIAIRIVLTTNSVVVELFEECLVATAYIPKNAMKLYVEQ